MTHWKLSTASVRWLVLGLVLWVCWPGDSQAQCRAYTAANTYDNGDSMGHLDCDTSGNLRVSLGATGSLGTNTAAAPTRTEGSTGNNSYNLSGQLRIEVAGQDTANNLLLTSGGLVRQTQILGTGGVPSTATDCASTITVCPTSFSVSQSSCPSGLAARLGENFEGIGIRLTISYVRVSTTSSAAVRDELMKA